MAVQFLKDIYSLHKNPSSATLLVRLIFISLICYLFSWVIPSSLSYRTDIFFAWVLDKLLTLTNVLHGYYKQMVTTNGDAVYIDNGAEFIFVLAMLTAMLLWVKGKAVRKLCFLLIGIVILSSLHVLHWWLLLYVKEMQTVINLCTLIAAYIAIFLLVKLYVKRETSSEGRVAVRQVA